MPSPSLTNASTNWRLNNMRRFIAIATLLIALTGNAVAGIMPSIELSGTGVVVSATKSGQIISASNVYAKDVSSTSGYIRNISSTVQDLTTLRVTNVSATAIDVTGGLLRAGNVTATGQVLANSFSGSGVSLTGVVAASMSWYGLTGIPVGVQAISTTSLQSNTLATLQQLSGTTVTSATWGRLGAIDQSLTTVSSPTFAGMTSSGSVAIGFTGTPSTTLDVSGSIKVGRCNTGLSCGSTQAGSFCYSSVSNTLYLCVSSNTWYGFSTSGAVSTTALNP